MNHPRSISPDCPPPHSRPESPEHQRIRGAICDPHLIERFTDPAFLATPVAFEVARRMQAVDSTVEVRLLRLLLPGSGPMPLNSWQATRILDIIAAITDGTRIQPMLAVLMRHPDSHVRSKAVRVLGGLNQNVGWLERSLAGQDARVRANAVESLWGSNSDAARALFLAAAEDSDHRVAANGVLGLHFAGDAAFASRVEHMANHPDPQFRAAAVWAMGQSQKPEFQPVLLKLLSESTGQLRRNILRALVGIRKALGSAPGITCSQK